MSRLNTQRSKDRSRPRTHEGALAQSLPCAQQLRRSVMSCMLWEKTFYENGKDIADRILDLSRKVDPDTVGNLAIEARQEMHLRHVSLLLLVALVGHPRKPVLASVGFYVSATISRPDELCELLAMYWRDGRKPIPKQLKIGLATAFTKFDEYQLAKYDRGGAIRLRDVMFLVHPKPIDRKQAVVFRLLANRNLATPDTWETNLSILGAQSDPAKAAERFRDTWTRLLQERRLGYLALLRNLRNMERAGVDRGLVRESILANRGSDRVLPFRYVAAARAAPQFEREIDSALTVRVQSLRKFKGATAVLVDVSGSMSSGLSAKSDLTRMDAAATLASVFPTEDLRVFTFSDRVVEVPARTGMAGVDAITKSQRHGSTRLAQAIDVVSKSVKHDRLVVITDEQASGSGSYFGGPRKIPDPKAKLAYMINVAPYANGVGYGKWIHIDGFSEQVLNWMRAYEDSLYL